MNKIGMSNFFGKHDDEGWSEEAWVAGYAAAVSDAIGMFKHLDTMNFTADEVAHHLEGLVK